MRNLSDSPSRSIDGDSLIAARAALKTWQGAGRRLSGLARLPDRAFVAAAAVSVSHPPPQPLSASRFFVLSDGVWNTRGDAVPLRRPAEKSSFLDTWNAETSDGIAGLEVSPGSSSSVELLLLRSAPGAASGRMSIRVGAGGRLLLMVRCKTSDGSREGLISDFLDIHLEEEASMSLVMIDGGGACGTACFTERAVLDANASFKATRFLAAGGRRHFSHVILDGRGASASMKTLLLADSSGSGHRSDIEHSAPDTKSNETQRILLAPNAMSWAEASTFVGPVASGACAGQDIRQIFLGETARAYALPELVIETDDVECSHGCVSGNFDDATLFYMMSRGLPLRIARNLLLSGFACEILSGMDKAPDLHKEANFELWSWLEKTVPNE